MHGLTPFFMTRARGERSRLHGQEQQCENAWGGATKGKKRGCARRPNNVSLSYFS